MLYVDDKTTVENSAEHVTSKITTPQHWLFYLAFV